MEKFVKRLDNAKKAIDDADYILIGAGAGFSAAAGMDYGGQRFEDNFKDFIDEYGLQDMYSATFYPYETSEEKWAYFARHIYLNRYAEGKTKIHEQLLDIVRDKDYFIITTNVDHQFWINGFDSDRIFATQGDYGLLQCSEACHDKLYSNELLIYDMLNNTEDCRIPSQLVPKCPVCGKEMEVNLRKDNFFVQDSEWYKMNKRYSSYLDKIDGKKVVFMELGVGFNTPTIIRSPFERMTYNNPNATLIRLNRSHSQPIDENIDKTISFDEDIGKIFDYWLSRI